MSNRLFKTLGAIIALLIFTPRIYLVSTYIISLIKMEDIIKFSGPIFIAFLSSPILLYSLVGSVWFLSLISYLNLINLLLSIYPYQCFYHLSSASLFLYMLITN